MNIKEHHQETERIPRDGRKYLQIIYIYSKGLIPIYKELLQLNNKRETTRF